MRKLTIDITYIINLLLVFLLASKECLKLLFPSIPWTIAIYFISILFIIKNIYRININYFWFIGIVFIIILLTLAINYNPMQHEFIKRLFFGINPFLNLWLLSIILSTVSDLPRYNQGLIRVAFIFMILLVLTVLLNKYSSDNRPLNYLGVGVSSTVWISFIIQKALICTSKEKKSFIICAILFTSFITFYGNRGSVIAICCFLVYSIFQYTNLKDKLVIFIGLILLIMLFAYFREETITFVSKILSEIGINSRNFTLLLDGELSFTTHRVDEIWVEVFQYAKDNYFIGNGIAFDRVIFGNIDLYSHNLILELWLTFGMVTGSIVALCHFYIGYKMLFKIRECEWRDLFAPFYITSTIVLMFNSSLWQLNFFWVSYGIYFAYKKWKKTNVSNFNK